MKISPTPNRPAVVPTPGAARATPSQPIAGGARTPASSAQVEISATSKQLLALQSGDNDIDMERVTSLRNAIAAGELRIDTSRIADGLIASARELLK